MVWSQDNRTGGFTNGKPWLPVPAEHLPRAADRAEAQADSLLHHYRKALALRHQHPALVGGQQTNMRAEGDVLQFRRGGGEELFIAANLSGDGARIAAPSGKWTPHALSDSAPDGADLVLAPWAVAILTRSG